MLNPAFYIDAYWDEGVKRYSNRTLGDDVWGEGRLLSVGEIVRSLSDPQGSWVRGRMSMDISDTDQYFRTAMHENKPMYQREVCGYIQADASRDNPAAVPLTVFRGFVDENAFAARMGGTLAVVDWLGHKLSPFNPDREIMVRKLTRGLFAQLPEDLEGVTQRIICGDHGDKGVKNSQGNLVAKGRVVAQYVGGTYKTVSDGSSVPPTYTTLYLDPPVVTAEVVGTPGTRKCIYSATSLTKYGETNLGNRVVLDNVPNHPSDTNYVRITVTPGGTGNTTYFSQVTGHRPYVYDGTDEEAPAASFHKLDSLYRIGAWETNHTRTYLDDGDDAHNKPKRAPEINSARLEGFVDGSGSGPTVSEWSPFFICGHAVNPDEIHQAFWPDWEGEDSEVITSPIPESAYGVSVLLPGKPGWPHATPYVDVVDSQTGLTHRMTMMYARGERAKKAIEGEGRFAFNMCGVEENGDGSGEPIRRGFFLVQLILNQFVALNGGEGYYTGLWGPLETFPNTPDVTLIDTLSIQDSQAFTAALLETELGALCDFIIDDNMTVGQFMQHVHVDLDCNSGPDMWGRLKFDVWNTTADVTAGNVYRRDIEFAAPGVPEIAYVEVENRLRFQMDYNNEDGEYESDVEELNDIVSQGPDGYRAIIGGESVLQLRLIRDLTTGRVMMGKRWSRRAWAGKYYTFRTNLIASRDEIGNQIQIADPQGFWGGRDTLAPFKVISMTLDPRLGEYTIRCRYLGTLIGETAPLLEDEVAGDVDFLLGDETLSVPPLPGAYRLQ